MFMSYILPEKQLSSTIVSEIWSNNYRVGKPFFFWKRHSRNYLSQSPQKPQYVLFLRFFGLKSATYPWAVIWKSFKSIESQKVVQRTSYVQYGINTETLQNTIFFKYILYISLFHTSYTAQFLGKISQSTVSSVCSSSLNHGQQSSSDPRCLPRSVHTQCLRCHRHVIVRNQYKVNRLAGPAQCAHQSHSQCLKLDEWFGVLIFIF